MTTGDGAALRVAIIDDHVAFAEALSLAINLTPDLECVATIQNADAAKSTVQAKNVQMLICDNHLPGGVSGIDIIRELRSSGIRLPTMILTGFPTPGAVTEAGQLGAVVVSKDTPLREIVTTIRSLRDGGPVSSAALRGTDVLSAGELRVLEHLGQGQRAADIAEELSLSVHTVRDHIKAILRKLEVSSQLEAVVEAQRRGLLAPGS